MKKYNYEQIVEPTAVCEYCGIPQTKYNRLEVHNFNGESFIICEVCLIIDKLGKEGKLGVRR